MQIVILPDPTEVGDLVAHRIVRDTENGTLRVLGVATGSSPLPVYEALRRSRSPALSALTAFALDEYVALDHAHPESYHSVIDREVTRPLGLSPERVHVPDGMAADIPRACAAYEEAISAAGGIDLQILGIGSTGHIGFNEPSSSFASRTRIKTLTPDTRAANARFFDHPDDVPTHCLTQGLGTIMEARAVVLVATGESKAAAVAAAVEGPVSAMCPGSILQHHPDATIVVDEAAASGLAHHEYYRFAFDNRPEWQR